jgi:alpha-amylase
MLSLIKEFGSAFKVSYSISGTALEQLETHVPEVIRSFRQLADTGQVEFIAETYAHSLSSLGNKDEFVRQVELHASKIEELFGKRPTTFRNTELIYSDHIGEIVADMGFHTMLTEGAKHILGWKSPNYMYCNNINPKLKVLLRNFRLSDDLTFRFSNQEWSEWPLTTEKFVKWLNKIEKNEEVVNLFLDYETIGEHQWKETGIFDFFSHLPETVFSNSNFSFSTPDQLYHKLQPVSAISVPHPISWADEERDLTAWLGNELQDEAFGKLYSYEAKVRQCKDPEINRDWLYLQTSNHFYYMCTKWFSAGEVHKYFNPYGSPYEAFINYMNVLSDFMIRVDESLNVKEPSVQEAEPIPASKRKSSPVKAAVKAKKKPAKGVKKAK